MKKLIAIGLALLLSGCVVYPYPAQYAEATGPIVGEYYIGYWRPGFGYWTGYGWDVNFYAYGHRGYGHYYRSPRGSVYRAPRANPGVPHYRYHH